MKQTLCVLVALGVILSLSACQNAEKSNFPLEADAVNAAIEQMALPWVLSESEDLSGTGDLIAHTINTEEGCKVIVSGSLYKREKIMTMYSVSEQVAEKPDFSWADWKRNIEFAAVLYGGFADQEELYLVLSLQEMPEFEELQVDGDALPGGESLHWVAKLPAGYCVVTWTRYAAIITHMFPAPVIEKWSSRLNVTIYETEKTYDRTAGSRSGSDQ